jgi:hypothetical protein
MFPLSRPQLLPFACVPHRRYAPVMTLGRRVDNFVNAKLYGAQRGLTKGLLGGIGIGGVLGAVAGFAAASNPVAGVAMAAASALHWGLMLGVGGAAIGGVLGLGSHHRFYC